MRLTSVSPRRFGGCLYWEKSHRVPKFEGLLEVTQRCANKYQSDSVAAGDFLRNNASRFVYVLGEFTLDDSVIQIEKQTATELNEGI
jgi:hypothetical protein